ncbi:MAG: hypothetical protein FJ077_11120 [Cyanobacteria bacterium K_DeepCast_35m_m2_023]|nr:hypothetical protein [Cyanobacteria bacterium K_DeepCast_35m_m2_023]
MQVFAQHHTASPATRSYRLIDSGCQLHQQLDGQYSSIEEAITEAIAWLEPLDDGLHHSALIGVEVSTSNGDWRTCRLPAPLLCPLLCMVPG